MKDKRNLLKTMLNAYMQWVLKHDTTQVYFVQGHDDIKVDGYRAVYAQWENDCIMIYLDKDSHTPVRLENLNDKLQARIANALFDYMCQDMKYDLEQELNTL